MYTSLITPRQLVALLNDEATQPLIFDCHHDLMNPEAGRQNWQENSIGNAAFLHLDEDLSGEIIPGQTGRHPLPDREDFLDLVKSKGYIPGQQQQVVVYDSKFGGIAARAWWMFKWIGHEKVAVLEGGYPAWSASLKQQMNRAAGLHRGPRSKITLAEDLATLKSKKILPPVTYDRTEVEQIRQSPQHLLIDSRTAERYRGEHEPIDPIAGHIEGAINLPWPDNLDTRGNFKDKEELKSRFAPLKERAAQNVFYCGSGVTACHNILAYYHAYEEMPGLYPGSWSEWILSR